MICCSECFKDPEVKATILSLGHKGECPLCGVTDTWLYDSESDFEQTDFEEKLSSIIKIYKTGKELNNIEVPDGALKPIEEHLKKSWNIFNGSQSQIKTIVTGIVESSLDISNDVLIHKVVIPELYDNAYLEEHSIMKSHRWEEFRKDLRNNLRFHSNYINGEVFEEILKDTVSVIPAGSKYYRARIMKNEKKYSKKDMGAPPSDIASAGRANSKGISCLYLSSKKETTVKEIRASAFDYVTIGTFRTKKDIRVVDLSSIKHNSPFYTKNDKIKYLINETHLKKMDDDLAKPVSNRDSELDYLPTQYISDFVKVLGYDGVKYISTFDKDAFNLALFDAEVCEMIYSRCYLIDNLDYQLKKMN